MNAYRIIDKQDWARRDLFDFYQKFDNPCLNISVMVVADNAYRYAKKREQSFFLLTLYAVLRAANAVPQVRQRIVDGVVVEFERIAVMTPIMTEQEMFREIWCEYASTFPEFAAEAVPKVEAAKNGPVAPIEINREDFLCASFVPWIHFQSISAAEYCFGQSIPILSWGKMHGGMIPISCKFNHSFCDGLHIGRFFTHIEESLGDPASLWKAEVPGR